MEISTKALQEYKKIYLEEHGVDLSDINAQQQAINLLKLMKLVYRPIPISNTKENDNE